MILEHIKCLGGGISVSEVDKDGDIGITVHELGDAATDDSFSKVYLDRYRAKLLVETLKNAYDLE